MRISKIAAVALGLGLSATSANAIPTLRLVGEQKTSAVEEAQSSWRYHNRCGWRGGRWVVELGGGGLVLCRPNRPGREWRWHSDGGRHGWYNDRRRRWHHNRW